MAHLLSVRGLSKSFGSKQLFRSLAFGVSEGDRIGLIGPNGAGKSTLLKCLVGDESADEGEIVRSRGLRLGYLAQSPSFSAGITIESAVMGDPNVAGGERAQSAQVWMSRLDLLSGGRTMGTPVNSLSGGWQKRVALARELVGDPDLLILDEPTNHLDVEGILWLERFLQESSFAVLMVTHDRLFLERTVNRILDLDGRYKSGLLDCRGTYSDYLLTREALLKAQSREQEVLSNQLRRETEWLRRGAKARQTKQKARIERAGDLKEEVGDLKTRNRDKASHIEFQSVGRQPQKLMELKGVSASRGGRKLFHNLDFLITPRTRLALLGANGCGKSTLIKTLLGVESPDTGQVTHSDQLQVAWFEQDKSNLNPRDTVLSAICPEGDYVQFQGRSIFARSYLDRFLFRTEQMGLPVAQLSGGEKSRLRIAQLMLMNANVLVLDEPTNDLDAATLDVLADSLRDFQGAVILVTHDRYFMDQVADQILAFPPPGAPQPTDACNLVRFASYEQWEVWFEEQQETSGGPRPAKISAGDHRASEGDDSNSGSPVATKNASTRKVSYKEKFEWETIEARILERESALEDLQSRAAELDGSSDPQQVQVLFQDIAKTQDEVEKLYARWAELEAVIKGVSQS